MRNNKNKQTAMYDPIDRAIREMVPGRNYSPKTFKECQEAIDGGNIVDGTIKVHVKDAFTEFPSGLLPCQKVTISFDYCRLRTDKGEIKFDRELEQNGWMCHIDEITNFEKERIEQVSEAMAKDFVDAMEVSIRETDNLSKRVGEVIVTIKENALAQVGLRLGTILASYTKAPRLTKWYWKRRLDKAERIYKQLQEELCESQ